MRKLQYQAGKQLEYRNTLVGHSFIDRNACKPLVAASLAGRDAIFNLESVEWQWYNRVETCIIALVEYDRVAVDIIIKDLKKAGFKQVSVILRETWGKRQNFVKAFRKPGTKKVFEVHYNTLKGYFRYATEIRRAHDIINCDYYNGFLKHYNEDIKIIRDNNLLAKNGDLFVTAPNPRRALTQPAVQYVIKQDQQGQSYQTGMKTLLKRLFSYKGEVIKAHSWQYRQDEDNQKCELMNVVRLRIA